ncbi:hypothetical protein [Nitrosomonas communis]|uniref:hypothetical protein n=1 Tax=Nitrosomonas communis TaxID=44574 RepID=UPI000B22F70F|nr:hypothetical protein [Nitrosomonas communis]
MTLPVLSRAKLDPILCALPLLQYRTPAGFPSPAEDYAEKGLDLNNYLIGIKQQRISSEWSAIL